MWRVSPGFRWRPSGDGGFFDRVRSTSRSARPSATRLKTLRHGLRRVLRAAVIVLSRRHDEMQDSPIKFTPGEVLTYYSARIPHLKGVGAELRGPCPVHQGKRDSFAVNANTGEAFCHSQCGQGWDMIGLERQLTDVRFADAKDAVFQIVGRQAVNGRPSPKRPRIVATYDYTDEAGQLLYQAVRMDPKDFRQRRPNGNGGWVWKLKGVRPVLYRLPAVLRRGTETVFVCEGEKDVHAIEGLGLLATCNPLGAG